MRRLAYPIPRATTHDGRAVARHVWGAARGSARWRTKKGSDDSRTRGFPVRSAQTIRRTRRLIGKVRRGLLWLDKPAGHRPQRRAVVATLVLAGPRVSELCGLPTDRVDLPGRRILIPPRDPDQTGPQTKTFAGERVVPMVPALRDILLAARADGAAPNGACGMAFQTRDGTRQTPSNIAHRVLAPTIALASELVRQRGQTPMPTVTPHALRRTFASILAECNVSPRRAMYLLGHTDPKLTLSIYQQVLDMSGDAVDVLERILGGSLEDIGDLLNGRTRRRRRTRDAEVDAELHDVVDRLR